jgi:multicomponent K+:H+ antiporter subunit D
VFVVASVALIGLPPLAGFVGKLSLLAALPQAVAGWAFPLILLSSLLALVALANAGSQLFWRQPEGSAPAGRRPRRAEWAAVLLLLGAGVALAVGGGPALRYTTAAAEQLRSPTQYTQALLGEAPVRRTEAAR